MSTVTTAVIMVAYGGEGIDAAITSHDFRNGQTFGKMPDESDEPWTGGSKFMECDLYAAGFNYVPGSELEAWFRSLPWEPDDAAFLVWDCNGETRGSASVGWVNW